ncbi:MAG: 3-deoxy-7-phosphoheptulonate synthase, partial [Pseudomonadota bacterium]|nr:3-deoxy-7-phosphoheptulonate synthase [Pseudomonadota bacterium]
MTWTPSSWRARPAKHIPEDYPDLDHLKDVEQRLAEFPPLVFAGEVRKRATALGGGEDASAKATAELAERFDGIHSVQRARDV